MTHPTELLPGYVLGDLTGPELESVETHLSGCADCRAEVARLRDALFSLADDLPDAALPSGAWQRLQARRTVSAVPRRSHRPLSVAPRLQRPRWPWLAAAAVVVLALGVITTRPFTEPSQQATAAQWEAQSVRRVMLTAQGSEPFGTLFVRPDGQALVVLTRPAPTGQVYQAWGRRGNGPDAGVPVSLGLTGGTVMQVGWRGYASVGISVEPAGGSPAPTQPLGRVALPGS
ncbi:hypothetical protein E7T06_16985 [Deinococcus sp. Arct2-2]|uniref:anti-sigma factor n=1 Tax=Deinococcus sp. Arct2-2 TaxID=2568653 RepID=UPI0010A515A6|nr:anti-sigma factor [Deinococcus sp. Arct2-2]THF68354.1 hypothetical protein E7T06_16985 [Deinococcus sp. Arct2-2]